MSGDNKRTEQQPDYYNKEGIECLDAIKAAVSGLNGYEGFLCGNMIKYAWRWKDKGGVKDIKKCQEYAQKLIEYYKEKETQN